MLVWYPRLCEELGGAVIILRPEGCLASHNQYWNILKIRKLPCGLGLAPAGEQSRSLWRCLLDDTDLGRIAYSRIESKREPADPIGPVDGGVGFVVKRWSIRLDGNDCLHEIRTCIRGGPAVRS